MNILDNLDDTLFDIDTTDPLHGGYGDDMNYGAGDSYYGDEDEDEDELFAGWSEDWKPGGQDEDIRATLQALISTYPK